MKNALLLGLAAAVLFAVSAGLSIWLNQPRVGEDAGASAKSTAKKGATGSESREKSDGVVKPVVSPTPTGDASEPLRLATQLQNELALIARREQEFERQQELYQIVIEDLRDEMEILKSQLKKPAVEKDRAAQDSAKPSAKKNAIPKLPPVSPDGVAKKPTPSNGADAALQNLRLATGITESMQPEAAARTIEQLAKSGKADIAVQLLAKLNPRQAAKILALISDEKLSAQLFEGLLATKVKPAASPP